MPYFKDTQNKLYFLDDASFSHLLPSDCVAISDAEFAELNAPPPETAEQTIVRLEGAIDRYLDAQAQSLRYDSIKTMVTYFDDPNPQFKAEGNAGLKLRSAVYTKGIELIGKVQSGEMQVPTEAELIELMPKITDFMPVIEVEPVAEPNNEPIEETTI